MSNLRSAAAMLAATLLFAHSAAADQLKTAFSQPAAGSAVVVDHAAWSGLLASHVKPAEAGLNRVAYATFKAKGHAELKRYVAALEAADVTKLGRAEQFAFWANLYNARTIDIVLDKYPLKSFKDVSLGGGILAAVTGGPWKAKVTKVNGIDLSLDDIEHNILRAFFKDPRVHYAVNCASVGCPNLGQEAFTGAKLDAQLEAAAMHYVNSPRGIQVANGRVTASNIYDWFKADFGGSDKGVLDHVRKYAAPDLQKNLTDISTISNFTYDWTLNDARN